MILSAAPFSALRVLRILASVTLARAPFVTYPCPYNNVKF